MPSLPSQFLNSLAGLDHLDLEAFQSIHQAESQITSIRLNPFKPCNPPFPLGQAVPWNSHAYYLEERPSFTYDPLFHAGCYYVQEAGSMFLEFALKQCVNFSDTLQVLDLCAAPGGKSTLLNSLMNENSLLISNDLIASRANTLAYNLSKWGTANTIVTNNHPDRFSFMEEVFDVLVIDAPCSGSGLFRKQPEALLEWSPQNVNQCGIRQKEILKATLGSLKENGILFYSTCSYSTEENEDIVSWLLGEFDLELVHLAIDKNWGIVETEKGYRFYPHLTKSEGFFCSVLRKRSGNNRGRKNRIKALPELSRSEKQIIEPYVSSAFSNFIKKNNNFHLLNDSATYFFLEHEKDFYFRKAGVSLGEIKGKDFVPNHELALSIHHSNQIRSVELGIENCLKFLKKENFSLPEEKQGVCLVNYQNQGLGWMKILPQRINNYLPSEFRILK